MHLVTPGQDVRHGKDPEYRRQRAFDAAHKSFLDGKKMRELWTDEYNTSSSHNADQSKQAHLELAAQQIREYLRSQHPAIFAGFDGTIDAAYFETVKKNWIRELAPVFGEWMLLRYLGMGHPVIGVIFGLASSIEPSYRGPAALIRNGQTRHFEEGKHLEFGRGGFPDQSLVGLDPKEENQTAGNKDPRIIALPKWALSAHPKFWNMTPA